MGKKKNGFTLVELIIAIAILAIAGVAISGFVSFCSKNFATSNRNIKLQYDQQIVVTRVRDVILETSRGIFFDEDNKNLIVLSDNQDYPDKSTMRYNVTGIRLDAENHQLKYGTVNLEELPTTTDVRFDRSESILSSSVTDFNVDLSDVEEEVSLDPTEKKLKKVKKVTVTLTFKVGTREITVNPVIALRNSISVVESDEDLEHVWDEKESDDIPYSHIASVIISRDGVEFSQGKTDTIKMAGDSTAADYDAKVVKKSSYKGAINGDVTWSIDPSTVKDNYRDCIGINATTGLVSLRKITKDGEVITPLDCMNNNYFVIIATSVEDSSKSAKLRIKVEEGGVYPISISTDAGSYSSPFKLDLLNGVAIYKFTHSIQYTSPIKDPSTGAMVNPLTGDGVYSKITYKCTTDVPPGAGFNGTGIIDGLFTVSKSMEGQTYHIVVEVNQKNQEGALVKDEFDITIPENVVPEQQDITVPMLNAADTADRGITNTISASWSAGIPVYKKDAKDEGTQYYYWYEWEVTNDDNSCENWGSDTRNSFSSLIDFKNMYGESLGKKYTQFQTERVSRVDVQPYLDWSKSFTIKVTLRVKLNTQNNESGALYYMLPGTDAGNPDNVLTGDAESAYVASKLITIKPVELLLTPAEKVKKYVNNQKAQGEENAIIDTRDVVGIGKRPNPSWSYEKTEQAKYYYKFFTPKFTGLNVTIFNYGTNISAYEYFATGNPKIKLADGMNALRPYRGREYPVYDMEGSESKIFFKIL